MIIMYKACGKYFNSLSAAASYSAKHGVYGSRSAHALLRTSENKKKKESK
jgi:hypothetical protein